MRYLLSIWDLVTSDALTLGATGVLLLTVLALVLMIVWPARAALAKAPARSGRSAEARALAASGRPAAEIARRTGLSRDALALMLRATTPATRQKAPGAARLSPLGR